MQEEGWRPSITVSQVLTGIGVRLSFQCDSQTHILSNQPCRIVPSHRSLLPIRPALNILFPSAPPGRQDLLNEPNPLSPAQSDAYMMFQQQRCVAALRGDPKSFDPALLGGSSVAAPCDALSSGACQVNLRADYVLSTQMLVQAAVRSAGATAGGQIPATFLRRHGSRRRG